MKLVVLDQGSVNPAVSWQPIKDLVDEFVAFDRTAPDEIAERIKGATIVITNKNQITADHIKQAPSVKLISLLATGFNNIDIEAAKQSGVVVSNARDYCSDSVAQQSFAMILDLARSLTAYHQSVQNGRWNQSNHFCFFDYPIIELNGLNLLLVGQGQIAKATAKLAEAFGMSVDFSNSKHSRKELLDKASKADFISLHCPLNKATEGMIDAAFFDVMKNSAFLVNTARGPIINEADLVKALQEKKIAGAALDVLSKEPPPADHPLLQLKIPQLILTPHTAWASMKAQKEVIEENRRNISAFLEGSVRNQVNP